MLLLAEKLSSLNSNLDEVKPAEKNLLCSHWLLTLHRRGGGLFDILASFRLGLLFCTLRNGSKLLVHFPWAPIWLLVDGLLPAHNNGMILLVDSWQICQCIFRCMFRTLSKAQRPRGLSSVYQSKLFRSYHKFLHKSWSNFIFRIFTKHQLENLNQIYQNFVQT